MEGVSGGGALSLGTLEDMLSLRMRASLSVGAHFHPRGTYVGGGSYTGDFLDE